MAASAFDAYRQVGTVTADPIALTSMLYEGALKAIRRARLFANSGDRQKFIDETHRAHLIIGELLSTLDLEQGDLPRTLAAVYAYCIKCIIQSTVGDVGLLSEAERHMTTIADAWKTATSQLTSAGGAGANAVA